jgi:ribosomal protein S6E (S10)
VQLNISYPANGSQKLIDIEDERKLAVFMEKRVCRTQPPSTPKIDAQRRRAIT